jgi:hypothetical protein
MSAEIVDFPRERLGSLNSVRCRTAPTERKKSEVQALVSARANPSAVWDLADLYLPIRVRNFSALFSGPKWPQVSGGQPLSWAGGRRTDQRPSRTFDRLR